MARRDGTGRDGTGRERTEREAAAAPRGLEEPLGLSLSTCGAPRGLCPGREGPQTARDGRRWDFGKANLLPRAVPGVPRLAGQTARRVTSARL